MNSGWFQEIIPTFSKSISEDVEKYFGKCRKLFRKISTIKSFVKFQIKLKGPFREVSRNITKIFENYLQKFQKKKFGKFW